MTLERLKAEHLRAEAIKQEIIGQDVRMTAVLTIARTATDQITRIQKMDKAYQLNMLDHKELEDNIIALEKIERDRKHDLMGTTGMT